MVSTLLPRWSHTATARPGDEVKCDSRRRQRYALMNTKQRVSAQRGRASCRFGCQRAGCDRISLPRNPQGRKIATNNFGIREMLDEMFSSRLGLRERSAQNTVTVQRSELVHASNLVTHRRVCRLRLHYRTSHGAGSCSERWLHLQWRS